MSPVSISGHCWSVWKDGGGEAQSNLVVYAVETESSENGNELEKEGSDKKNGRVALSLINRVAEDE